MRNKLILFALLAVTGVVVLAAVTAVAVFAFSVGQDMVQSQEAITTEAVEAAPVMPIEVEPVNYTTAGRAGSGGCNWAAKQQMTQHQDKEDLEISDQLLTQAQ